MDVFNLMQATGVVLNVGKDNISILNTDVII